MRRLDISMQDRRQLESAHFAHIGRAKNRERRIPLDHGQSVSGLSGVHHLEAFLLQRLSQSLCEEDVAVDQQQLGNAGLCGGGHQLLPSASRSRLTTSTISFSSEINPITYCGSGPV